jgi:hypothetical protein
MALEFGFPFPIRLFDNQMAQALEGAGKGLQAFGKKDATSKFGGCPGGVNS